MKKINLLLLVLGIVTFTHCDDSAAEPADADNAPVHEREYYQLKVYTFDSADQIGVVDRYLEDAYLPGLKRQGIGPVGVFKLRPTESDTVHKTYVLLPFKTIDQFLALDDQLNEDEAYLAAGSEYLNATHDQAPYQRIESTLMLAFPDFPVMQASRLDNPRSERVYELRSYESPTEAYYKNKVDMFNAGGEIKLFDRLDFNAVFYGEVISGCKMPNLMYMTTFSDQASRDELWEAFFDSPEWKGLMAMPKYENNVSHADIILLVPTEYSDY